ncbi:MAG: PAS domain S-box protein [Ferruginibacter sp.]
MTNAYLKAVLDNSPQSIVLIGKNHEVLVFNKSIKNVLFEFFKREIKVGDFYYPDFVVEPNRKFYLEAFEAATNGIPFQIQLHSQIEDVSIWFDYKMLPVYDEKNELLGVTLSAEDITAEKEAELKISNLSEKFKAILDNTDEAIILLDLDYKVLTLNQVAANTIQHNTNLDSFEGRDYRAFVPDKSNKFYEFYPLAVKGESSFAELLYQNILGEKLCYQTKFNPVYDQHEKQIGVSIFAKDITDQKKLENDLSHLFDAITDIICILDFEGKILKMNKSGCELLGQSQDDLLFQAIEDFVILQDKNIFSNALRDLDEESPTFKLENRCIAKSGEAVWLSWTCNSSSAEGLIYATAKNITEEKKLRELNRQVSNLAKIGSWELDVVHHRLFWSDEVHQLHETDSTTFVPHIETAINFYREDFRQNIAMKMENCIATGEPYDFEAVLITANKKELWVRVIVNAEFADGKCKRIYGSFQDINSLKESENRLVSLSENLPGVVYQYLIHPDGKDSLSYVAGAVEQVWGFTPKEVMEDISLVWNQVKAGGDLEKVTEHTLKSIQTKSKLTIRYKYVLPTGKLRTHLINGTPIFMADGTIIFNAILLDITQEVKNEELLEQVNKVAKIGSWEFDVEENLLYWSKMIHQILETDSESFVPDMKNDLSFYREDFRPFVQAKVKVCAEEGEEFDYEAIIVTANKNEKWVRAIGRAEMIDSKPHRIFGSLQDITEQKKAEHKKNSLQETLEKSLNDIHIFDAETLHFSYVNQSALFNLGYKEHELNALTALSIKPDLTASSFKQLVTPLLDNKKDKIIFYTNYKRKDESLYPVEVHLQLITEGSNKKFLAVSLDITERKKSEEDIRDSEEKRRLIMNGALDAIICIDIHDKITFWNPQAEVIFGWKESEVMAQSLSALIVPEPFRKYHNEGIKHYLKTGEGKAINTLLELTAIKRSGDEFPIELTVIPVKQGDGVFFCAFIRDITQRKKTEDLLDKSNRLARIGNWEADLVNATVYWSPVTREIHEANAEYEPDLYKDLEFYKEGENRKRITQCVQNCINHGATWDEELEIATLKGNMKWIRTIGQGECRDGKCIRIYGSFQDITERRKTETLLQESENKFRSLIENSGDMLTLITADGKMDYISPSVEKTFGYTNEENKTRQAIEVVHPDDLPVAMQVLESAFKNPGVAFSSTIRNRKKDGTYIWVEGTITNMLHVPGVNAIVANIRDITESKKAEEKILLINERLQLATRAANVGIWDLHIENNSLIWDENMYKLYGVNPADFSVAYDAWERGLHPDDLRRATNELQTTIREGKKFDTEFRVVWPDKTIHYIKADAIVYRDTAGLPVRLVGTNRDITQSKKAEEELIVLNRTLTVHADELKRSNEELEQFAFIASHDLQEPLRMISSFMDQLNRKYGDRLDDKAHQYIYFATDGAKRMKQIILDLLQYSRTNRPTEGKKEVDLNQLLSEFKQLRRKLVSEKSASIKYNDLPTLNTYKAAITQIFHGILDNALKYSIEGIAPIIEISAVENEMEWQFSIRDNGIGISPEFYDKIFVIFQRLHNRNQYSGTGIGLSIAKRHVEFLGGRIWLESAPEEGSVFYFTIPKN